MIIKFDDCTKARNYEKSFYKKLSDLRLGLDRNVNKWNYIAHNNTESLNLCSEDKIESFNDFFRMLEADGKDNQDDVDHI